MSSNKEQAYGMLKEFIKATKETPLVAAWFVQYAKDLDRTSKGYPQLHIAGMAPFNCIRKLGGMAGEW